MTGLPLDMKGGLGEKGQQYCGSVKRVGVGGGVWRGGGSVECGGVHDETDVLCCGSLNVDLKLCGFTGTCRSPRRQPCRTVVTMKDTQERNKAKLS